MSRSLRRFDILAVLIAVSSTTGVAQDAPSKSLAAELPRIAPRSPEGALRSFELTEGYRIELVAAEPVVIDPIDMAFDEEGRIWVVEMIDYPFDEREDQKPRGRVRLLIDEDGDGVMDHGHVFAEKLSWPTAIACWDGGVFVAVAPHIRFMKDTDGDHRADLDEIVFEGLGRKNVQALVNNIRWSLDGWFVAASGGNGGILRSRRMKNAAPVNLRGRDFRFRATGEIEPLTGGGQFGQSLDDFGRRFVCNNSDHARHVVLEHRYLVRNPRLAVPRAIASIAVEGPSSAVFRRSPPEPWRVVRTRLRVQGRVPGPVEHGGVAAGFFTSATGITVYRGDALPGCDGDLFIGDVASNLVHHKRLTVAGASFTARRVEDGREFLASPDIWFRPCNFANGPDGALYLCDMYREVIEHPWSLPDRIKKHLDLHSGDDRGRIWRVTAADAPVYQRPQLGKASTQGLVAALAGPGGWWRDTASRLLFERRDAAAIGLLVPVLEDDEPAVRAAALWLLQELGGLTDAALRARLRDPVAGLREQALRVVERRTRPAAWAEALSQLVADPSTRFRFQLACTLGSIEGDAATLALAKLARRDGGETWNRFAILSSVTSPERARQMFEELVAPGRGEVARSMLRSLAGLIGAWGNDRGGEAVLTWLTTAGREHPGAWAVADGFASGRGQDLSSLTSQASRNAPLRSALESIFESAAVAAADPSSSKDRRLEAVTVLRSAPFGSAGPVLLGLLDSRVDRALQSAAMRALSAHRDSSIAPALLARWGEQEPALRGEILDFLFERAERLRVLLAQVEDGRVPKSDLDRTRRERLAKHRDAGLRARAEKIFGHEQTTDRAGVIAAYAAALEVSGDAGRGKTVFEKHCASCHRLEGVGKVIGPDLRSVATRSPLALLEQILDPNREVNPVYLLYTLTTTDGRDLAGIISSETATSLTLKRADGHADTVLRSEVASLRATGLSLMPVGLEAAINQAAMRDLIAYLRK